MKQIMHYQVLLITTGGISSNTFHRLVEGDLGVSDVADVVVGTVAASVAAGGLDLLGARDTGAVGSQSVS